VSGEGRKVIVGVEFVINENPRLEHTHTHTHTQFHVRLSSNIGIRTFEVQGKIAIFQGV
jgi:hypothetical protein